MSHQFRDILKQKRIKNFKLKTVFIIFGWIFRLNLKKTKQIKVEKNNFRYFLKNTTVRERIISKLYSISNNLYHNFHEFWELISYVFPGPGSLPLASKAVWTQRQWLRVIHERLSNLLNNSLTVISININYVACWINKAYRKLCIRYFKIFFKILSTNAAVWNYKNVKINM